MLTGSGWNQPLRNAKVVGGRAAARRAVTPRLGSRFRKRPAAVQTNRFGQGHGELAVVHGDNAVALHIISSIEPSNSRQYVEEIY